MRMATCALGKSQEKDHDQASSSTNRRTYRHDHLHSLDTLDCFVIDQIGEVKMTHSKRKLAIEEIESFRKFLERRGFKCRNGKGRDQLMQVQNQGAPGQNVFCKTAKGAVSYPAIFDDLVELFHAPVDPAPAVEVIDHPASHDSDLLDDFAIAALQGMLSGDSVAIQSESHLAKDSYTIAKAMMAERAKHQPK